MVDFGNPYGHMPSKGKSIEEPIYPMAQVGQTIPEQDQRYKNVVQTAQAAIRGGAGVLQIVMMSPHVTGRGAHMHGKDMREALRELQKHSEATFVGVELPTSLTNVSGLNGQKGTIDEETRKQHLDEIKHAIEFVADAFQGGGTDVVSFEFPRRMYDMDEKLNPKTKDGTPYFENYPGEGKHVVVRFVDPENGQINAINLRDGKHLREDPSNPGVETEEFFTWNWDSFITAAKKINEKNQREGKPQRVTPQDLLKKHEYEGQINLALGDAARQRDELDKLKIQRGYARLEKKRVEEMTDKERKDWEFIKTQENYILTKEREVEETRAKIDRLRTLSDFAKEKSIQSYAELARFAMEEQASRTNMKKSLYVGPEIGHPHSYGGHPLEFVELIQEARNKFAQDLVDNGFQGKSYTFDEAMKEAKVHIKGTFDTGHVGMWLKHFRPDIKNYQKRKEEFNKWYLEQVEKIAEADVVGAVQIVDAYGGEHGHLPPGQGIFPIKESMDKFKKHGFDGYIVSEGHEEEKYEEGRIRTQAWRLMGSPVFRNYGGAAPSPTFQSIQNAYSGRTYSPKHMFGSYSPPFGEYRPWSDIPFE